MSKAFEIREMLIREGFRVTPQRMAILEAVIHLNNHPTADQIIGHIKKAHPNIAVGTVYKALETFFGKGIINKVYTENDVTRYDAVKTKHHHLYHSDSHTIEDYYDNELVSLIAQYFSEHEIPAFTIEDIKIQIIGKQVKKKSKQ